MIRKPRGVPALALMFGIPVLLVALAEDASATGRGGGLRPRPHVSREGPARSGSLDYNRARDRGGRPVRPVRERRDRFDDRPVAPVPGPAPAPVQRERREDLRDDRRDYYDDRRDFARGVRYSASWWSDSCSSATVVVVDGYSYYGCDGVWFSRTYYGGEVIYTVVDAPPGY